MSVLVFGATGQVGGFLSRIKGVMAITRQTADLQRPAECARIIRDLRPQAVINCAGINGRSAETCDDRLLFCVNAAAPTAMGEACAALDIPFVHVSGVEVFDGKLPMPYIPSDKTTPQGAIGMARLAGEEGIRASGCPHAILRTALIFQDALQVVLNRLDLPTRQETIVVPRNVICAPIAAGDLSNIALAIAAALKSKPEKSGTYHVAGDEDVTLAAFVQAVLTSNHVPLSVTPPSDMQPIENFRLDCRTTHAVFGVTRPPWRTAVQSQTVKQKTDWDMAI